MELQELKNIYSTYEEKLDKVIAAAPPFAGAFHMGDDPRDHACNDEFYESVRDWTAAFAASEPSPAEAAEAAELILEAAYRNRNRPTFWYLYAAQKHVEKLIPLFLPEQAGNIREKFAAMYPKSEWLPMQQEVHRMLSAAARGTASIGRSAQTRTLKLSNLLKNKTK